MAKKCKNCKQPFEPLHFNQKYCFAQPCQKVWIESEKLKQWRKRKKEIKEQTETLSDLLKLAQKHFNTFIRLRDRDKPCISCGGKLGAKYDAGHYYSAGGHYALRFDENNVHAQCVQCNQHLHGNLTAYRVGLIERIGFEKVEELDAKSQETSNYTRENVKNIIQLYKSKSKCYKC
jgi:hypothetical protein